MSYIDRLIDNCHKAKIAIPLRKFVMSDLSELADVKRAIFIIEQIAGDTEKTFLQFRRFKQGKTRACARPNAPSRVLYVGSSTSSLRGRIAQHMGRGNNGTYALHLDHWFKGEYRITVKEYDVPLAVLQIIEDDLSDALKPASESKAQTASDAVPVIRITSSDEFKRLLSALADDIVDAHIHSEMFIKLRDALASDTLVLAQSNTFWQLTLKAHHETAIGCLSRAFDQEPSALHLRNWLETIRANLHLFSEPEFRTRLKDNPFVDSLAATPRTPDAKTLDADIALCSDTDPVVQKLVAYRNTSVAHQSSKLAARGKTLPTNMVPTGVEFEWLLDRAESILNKYSELFAANIHFTKIIGHDDFQYVIKSVASEVERSRAERRLDSL